MCGCATHRLLAVMEDRRTCVRLCGVCGGYGVPHIIFELRMSRLQRDGCRTMRTSRVDRDLELLSLGSGRVEGADGSKVRPPVGRWHACCG